MTQYSGFMPQSKLKRLYTNMVTIAKLNLFQLFRFIDKKYGIRSFNRLENLKIPCSPSYII